MTRNESSAPLHGLVLAGGQSLRMGQDKGALVYPALSPLPTALRLWGLLRPFCAETFLSLRPGQAGHPPAPRIDDAFRGGPSAGLLSARAAIPEARAWLVVACDLPLLTESAVRFLVRARDPSKAATCHPGNDGRPEPLFAIWEPCALTALSENFAAGFRSPRATLERLPCHLPAAPWPSLLANVNTPAEVSATSRHFPPRP